VTRPIPPVAASGLLACLALTACPPRAAIGGEASSYEATVARWTAQAELYRLEDVRAKFAATLLSETFRRALVREEALRLEFGPDQVDQLMQQELAQAAANTVFILGMYVDPPRDNNLGRKSNWRITLMTSTEELRPVKIEDLGSPNENERALYPYLEPFWKEYRIAFKLVTSPGPWTLRIASDMGTAKLVFLQPTGSPSEGEPHQIPVSRMAPEGNL
jgi:hypothetical protein